MNETVAPNLPHSPSFEDRNYFITKSGCWSVYFNELFRFEKCSHIHEYGLITRANRLTNLSCDEKKKFYCYENDYKYGGLDRKTTC